MNYISDLFSQPWFGSVLGALGLLAAIFFYWRSKKCPRLAFQHDSVSLLGSSDSAFPDEVEIKFSGTPISRVTAETIVLWNAGNITLGGAQIVPSDPLRIETETGEILKTRTLKVTREVNAISARPMAGSKTVLEINFDYLDPEDGITLEVLHTGGRHDLKLCGTLRGMPDGVKDFGRVTAVLNRKAGDRSSPFSSVKVAMVTAFVLGMLTAAFGFLRPQLHAAFPSFFESKPFIPDKPSWTLVFAGLTYAAMPVSLYWLRRRRYPASLQVDPPESERKK